MRIQHSGNSGDGHCYIKSVVIFRVLGYHPRSPIQSLHMGPKYNVQTCCREFSVIQKYWGHVCLSKGRICQKKSDPDGPITACDGHEKEGKAIHSFIVHPKPPYGSQIQCANMLQRIQRHPKVLGTHVSLKRAEVRKSDPDEYYLLQRLWMVDLCLLQYCIWDP